MCVRESATQRCVAREWREQRSRQGDKEEAEQSSSYKEEGKKEDRNGQTDRAVTRGKSQRWHGCSKPKNGSAAAHSASSLVRSCARALRLRALVRSCARECTHADDGTRMSGPRLVYGDGPQADQLVTVQDDPATEATGAGGRRQAASVVPRHHGHSRREWQVPHGPQDRQRILWRSVPGYVHTLRPQRARGMAPTSHTNRSHRHIALRWLGAIPPSPPLSRGTVRARVQARA